MDIDADCRWKDIDRQLGDLANGKVVDGDPATIEAELLREQDELESEAGEQYFRTREDECWVAIDLRVNSKLMLVSSRAALLIANCREVNGRCVLYGL